MRFTIFGAGAIGGVMGGRLRQSGEDVRLVARGAHAAAIADRGLTLRSPDGDAVVPVPVVDSTEGLDQLDWRPDDVVVLGVKSDATIDVIDELARVAPPTSTSSAPRTASRTSGSRCDRSPTCRPCA